MGSHPGGEDHMGRPRFGRVVVATAYWLAVCSISVAIAVLFIAVLVSRDDAPLEPRSPAAPATARPSA